MGKQREPEGDHRVRWQTQGATDLTRWAATDVSYTMRGGLGMWPAGWLVLSNATHAFLMEGHSAGCNGESHLLLSPAEGPVTIMLS